MFGLTVTSSTQWPLYTSGLALQISRTGSFVDHLLDSSACVDNNQTSTDGVPIYPFRVSAGHWMHASHAFHMVLHVGIFSFHLLRSSVTTSTSIIGVLSGVWISHHQGTCRSAHHGFTTSISISIRGVFLRLFYFAFPARVREIIKKRACISSYALETWDHGLNGSSKHYPYNCSLFFFFLFFLLVFSRTEVSACHFFYCHAVNSGWLCWISFGGLG
jgi:hypothetical protein